MTARAIAPRPKRAKAHYTTRLRMNVPSTTLRRLDRLPEWITCRPEGRT